MSSMAFTSLLAFLVLCAVTVEADRQFGRKCRSIKASGVDAASQRVIVDTHNKLRSTVANGKVKRNPQPPASNMRALTWDDKLAALAQRQANQCKIEYIRHNDQRFQVGQNIYWSGRDSQTYSPEWEKVINGWYSEVDTFNKNEVTKLGFGAGDYTQLVWAETSKVGCGYIAFTDVHTPIKYYVCNYGKAGNLLGETVYKKGKASSMCTNGTSGNSQGLCQ